MVSFILRRIFVSVLILLAASFIMYMLTAYSSDPLADLLDLLLPDQLGLLSPQINTRIDVLINLVALGNRVGQRALRFPREEMLEAAALLRAGVEIVSAALTVDVDDWHGVN